MWFFFYILLLLSCTCRGARTHTNRKQCVCVFSKFIRSWRGHISQGSAHMVGDIFLLQIIYICTLCPGSGFPETVIIYSGWYQSSNLPDSGRTIFLPCSHFTSQYGCWGSARVGLFRTDRWTLPLSHHPHYIHIHSSPPIVITSARGYFWQDVIAVHKRGQGQKLHEDSK